MAKLSGFFMSTLLIVLCLWINVCHYPDAAGGSSSNGIKNAAPVDVVPQSVSPASEPVDEPTDEEESSEPSGLFAETDVKPRALDVSASLPALEESDADPAALPPVLEPASFPTDGAEIDDAPSKNADSFSNETVSNADSLAALPTSQTASPAVATPTQDVRRSASKPRGAKYVRVPEVEIDAFSGGVRAARSSNDETRVVGATRAGSSLRVAPSAP